MASKKLGDLIKEARMNADLTQEQLKRIAKATGVTQASLLSAAKSSSAKASSSTAGKTSIKVTATEKKLVELYRKADAATKKEAMNILKGEDSSAEDVLETIMDSVQSMLGKK